MENGKKLRNFFTAKNLWQQDITFKERTKAGMKTAGMIGITAWLYYRRVWAAIFLILPGIWLYREFLEEESKKKEQEFQKQFREMIQTLSSALNTGYSVENAFYETQKELKIQYPEEARISRELLLITRKLRMHIPVEQVLEEFAERVPSEDVKSFVTVFVTAKKSGGDMIGIIRNTTSQIGDILDRLSYYGADMENEIERIQLFTDNSGELFRDQVGKYMKHKYGIAWADKYLGNVSLWKNQEEKADEFTEEEEKQNDQLKDLLGEQEAELPEEENPMQHVAELKRSPILELVLPKDKTISEKQISLQEMPEKRENHTGYGAFSDVEPEDGTLTSVLLGEYVIDHFTDFTDGPKGGELDYERLYEDALISGRKGTHVYAGNGHH